MSTQYDEMSPGSPLDVLDHPDHNHSELQNTKVAGDVVPLPIQPSNLEQMIRRGPAGPSAVMQKDSAKVTSYSTFVAKKIPMPDK